MKNVSGSQIETFERCPRLWWLNSVLKKRGPESPSLLKGQYLHYLIECYLKDEEIDLDKFPNVPEKELINDVFLKAIETGFLPKFPVLPEDIEEYMVIDTGIPDPDNPERTIPYIGYIDVHHRKATHIIDHKSTKNIKYAKSPKPGTQSYLGDSPKDVAYALYGLKQNPFARSYDITLKYYPLTDNPKFKDVKVTVSRQHAESIWNNRILPVVHKMIEFKNKTTKENFLKSDLPSSSKACAMYGGCDFMELCAGIRDFDNNLTGEFPTMTSFDDFLKEIEKKKNEGQPELPPAKASNSPSPGTSKETSTPTPSPQKAPEKPAQAPQKAPLSNTESSPPKSSQPKLSPKPASATKKPIAMLFLGCYPASKKFFELPEFRIIQFDLLVNSLQKKVEKHLEQMYWAADSFARQDAFNRAAHEWINSIPQDKETIIIVPRDYHHETKAMIQMLTAGAEWVFRA